MQKNELPCWAALAIIAGLLLLAVFVWQFPQSSSEWAAWVQAFGTIAAVVGGIYVSRSDLRARDRQEQRRKQRAKSKVIAIAKRLQSLAAELKSEAIQVKRSSPSGYFESQVPVASVHKAVDLLAGCDLESLDGSDFFLRIADLREAAHFLVRAMVSAQNQYDKFGCVPYDELRGHTDVAFYIDNIVRSLNNGEHSE